MSLRRNVILGLYIKILLIMFVSVISIFLPIGLYNYYNSYKVYNRLHNDIPLIKVNCDVDFMTITNVVNNKYTINYTMTDLDNVPYYSSLTKNFTNMESAQHYVDVILKHKKYICYSNAHLQSYDILDMTHTYKNLKKQIDVCSILFIIIFTATALLWIKLFDLHLFSHDFTKKERIYTYILCQMFNYIIIQSLYYFYLQKDIYTVLNKRKFTTNKYFDMESYNNFLNSVAGLLHFCFNFTIFWACLFDFIIFCAFLRITFDTPYDQIPPAAPLEVPLEVPLEPTQLPQEKPYNEENLANYYNTLTENNAQELSLYKDDRFQIFRNKLNKKKSGECAICYDDTDLLMRDCMHEFCVECFIKLTSSKCPVCGL